MNNNLSEFIITSEFRYKFDTLRFWLKNHNNISTLQILAFIFRPSRETISKTFIRKVVKEDGYIKIFLRGIKDPLFCPKSMSMEFFRLVVGEVFYPFNFHYYESFGTGVSKDDVVVDCGAAEGAFTIKVKDECKHIYAIEPLPMYIDSLRKSFSKCKNVEILPCGVSGKKGTAWLTNQDVCSRLSKFKSNSFKVKLTTIDELFYKQNIPITYLKIDVEGSDLNVLKGALKSIKKYKPKISVATYHNANHARKMAALIKGVNSKYKITLVGIDQWSGNYVTLHAWID